MEASTGSDGYNLNWSLDYYEANAVECDRIIESLEDFDAIPRLTKDNFNEFKDGDLVRYAGMVQDMLNPEYFYSSYVINNSVTGDDVVKSGKFRDIAPCQENEQLKFDGSVTGERLVYFCIPFPGMSSWVRNLVLQHLKNSNPGKGSGKRESHAKRPLEEEGNPATDTEMSEDDQSKKKVKTVEVGEGGDGRRNESHSTDNYFPLHDSDGLPCLVKLYEKEDKCGGIILNDRVEFVGFLSVNHALESAGDAEDRALNPPPSLVPRIHTVRFRKLSHINPLLGQNFNKAEIAATAESVRSDLHLTLTQILYGDDLAADYLICHLLSRIYSRDNDEALGKFGLNIFNVPAGDFGHRLYSVLEGLVTHSLYVPLTVASLNDELFVPKKDYESNRLWSGRLQLCDDTHLVVDETKMNEGKLNSTGCLNVSALHKLTRDQEIHYDFFYYSVKYDTNIPVLILSEGKSMFEPDIRLKLTPDPTASDTIGETFDAASFFLRGETSERIRAYLTAMRLLEFEMSEEMTKRIGDDYVALRQRDSGVNSGDLHNLLVLSRLLALSRGRGTLTADDWSRALDMENKRKSRMT